MKKYITLIALALIVVFIASNMSYSQQSIIPELRQILKNEPFKDTLSLVEITYWGQTISVETKGYVHFIEFLIRKATHFNGFGIIGLIFFLFYRKMNIRWAPFLAIFSVLIIGAVDEYHQTTIPGRTGVFQDVILDSAGAVFYVTLAYLIIKWRTRRKMKKTEVL